MVMGMKAPISKEQLEQLKEKAKDFFLTFGKHYALLLPVVLFDCIEKDQKDKLLMKQRKLNYRQFDKVEWKDPNIHKGECYVRSGMGPGDFGMWKKVFIVETQHEEIMLYKKENGYTNNKPPWRFVGLKGYIINDDPQKYFKERLQEMTKKMGITDAHKLERKFTAFIAEAPFAIVHPERPCYVFTFSAGVESSMCSCCGGDSGDVEKDDELICCLRRCTDSNAGNKSVMKETFAKTVSKMKDSLKNLADFTDDGTEGEILGDMLMTDIGNPLLEESLENLKQVPGRFRIPAYYKAKGLIQRTLDIIVGTGWAKLQEEMENLLEKLQPKIDPVIGTILGLKVKVIEKFQDVILRKTIGIIGRLVTPLLQYILSAFSSPIDNCIVELQKTLLNIKVNELPEDKEEAKVTLNGIPRSKALRNKLHDKLSPIVTTLGEIVELSSADHIDPHMYKRCAVRDMLEVLDAAVYTIGEELERGNYDENMKQIVLESFEHDIRQMSNSLLCKLVLMIVFPLVDNAISAQLDEATKSITGLIPEEVAEFLNFGFILEDALKMILEVPIAEAVDSVYPRYDHIPSNYDALRERMRREMEAMRNNPCGDDQIDGRSTNTHSQQTSVKATEIHIEMCDAATEPHLLVEYRDAQAQTEGILETSLIHVSVQTDVLVQNTGQAANLQSDETTQTGNGPLKPIGDGKIENGQGTDGVSTQRLIKSV